MSLETNPLGAPAAALVVVTATDVAVPAERNASYALHPVAESKNTP